MTRSHAVTYAVAVVASLGAGALSLVLEPLVHAGDFPLLLGAVMLAAWYGGLGPGLVATLLGGLSGILTVGHHGFGFVSLDPSTLARLGIFLLEAVIITSLSAALRRAERRAESLAQSEQQARAAVEEAATRVRRLQSVTDTALSHLQLDDLLRELIGRVHEALAADTVVILLFTEDGTELAVRAAHGLEDEVRQGIRIPVGRGIAGRIVMGQGPQVFEDLDAVEISSPVLRAKRLQSLLGAPLVVERRTIGVVHVGSLSTRRFTPDETRLLQLVADRIATAIDRSRLFEAEQGARWAAEAAERRFRLLVDGVRDYATYMLDPGGYVVSWNAGAERLKGYRETEVLGRHLSFFYAAEDARTGVAHRALQQAAAEGRYEEETWRLRKDGSRFWADVVLTALRDADGRLLGYALITHDLTERKRAAEVRARLLDQVITAQEEEQRRLARELHDETGQSLTSLLVGLRALGMATTVEEAQQQADELRRVAVRTLDEVRRLARGLRPGALDELGLVAALEHYVAEYGQARGIVVDLESRGLGPERLPPPVETALYRIIQEALTNVGKHAGARTVNIVLQRLPDGVQALVADDGSGFDVAAAFRAPSAGTHLGLHGMRERAALLGGSVVVESTAGEGTTVYARITLGRPGNG